MKWDAPLAEKTVASLLDKAIVASIPTIIKARPAESSGRRLVECQVSCEAVDYDGDVILQQALVGSAATFVATGHLDIDHLSEFGERMGLPNPAGYIVGRPLEVKALSNGDTWMLGEISRSMDGTSDPARFRYDGFWESLQRNPAVPWFSSVYGFPSDMEDCASGACTGTPATRYVIKAMDWRSLAFTRTPKNEALTGHVRIVTAKSHLVELMKSMSARAQAPQVAMPNSMSDVWEEEGCKDCEIHKSPSLIGYKRHFQVCKSMAVGSADICAHAAMHKRAMVKALACG